METTTRMMMIEIVSKKRMVVMLLIGRNMSERNHSEFGIGGILL